ncbi:unnamed protein product [Amoebophrya sp. A120]|nr:unnamed protein product [Amoebophrya sp. A120]|eukprot:GSA120T00021989001.1
MLERSPRTVLYLISVAICVYLFEEVFPFFAEKAFSSGLVFFRSWRIWKMFTSAVQSRKFRSLFFVLLPLLAVLFLDALVVIRGRYFILGNDYNNVTKQILGSDSTIFVYMYAMANTTVIPFTKHFLHNEPMLMDYVLDFPTTFAFYHLIKLLMEERSTTGPRMQQVVPPASPVVVVGTVVGIGPDQVQNGVMEQKHHTLVGAGDSSSLVQALDARAQIPAHRASPSAVKKLVHVFAQLTFGMNLSNIFVLHYVVGYGLQFPLRINFILFPSLFLFVVMSSAFVNLVVYLFVEKPCANLSMKLLSYL